GHQVVEIGAPEAGHVALERARVPNAPGAEGPVAGEAAEVARDLAAARRARLVGEELPRGGTQEGDQIVHLPSGHEAPVGRHVERRLLHLRTVVGILALAARRAVEAPPGRRVRFPPPPPSPARAAPRFTPAHAYNARGLRAPRRVGAPRAARRRASRARREPGGAPPGRRRQRPLRLARARRRA